MVMPKSKNTKDGARDYVLQVRLSEPERRQLEVAAEREKLDLSTWVRRVALLQAEAMTARMGGKR